jgi:hypothetical protein
MIDLGLTAADRRAFEQALTSSHSIRVEVDVLDRDENTLGPLGLRVISGAVQVDAQADVDRSLSLTCLDPEGRFNWAPQSPADAGLYADNFLAVRYVVEDVPSVGDVPVPVFQGPVTSVARNGNSLDVQALGKESLFLDPHMAWSSLKIEDRTPVDQAINRILRWQGERRLNLNPQKLRVADPVVVATGTEPWKPAAKIAADANRQLFYDGRGRARLRTYADDASFRFVTGPGGNVLSPPQITYSIDGVRNAVEVLGPQGKGPSVRPRVTAVAERSHPLSPWSLARAGVPRYLVHRIELDKTASKTAMRNMAASSLNSFLMAEVQVAFDALPFPHLEPMDCVSLTSPDLSLTFRLQQFTVPLTATDSASVGFLQRVRVSRRRAS